MEFAELLAGRGWAEEAIRHIRQALPSLEEEDRLMERCVAALVRHRADSAGSSGPEKLCRGFPKGTPTGGLPESARESKIFRVVLLDPDKRTVLDKPLSEFTPDDWDVVEERLAGLQGRMVLTNPPSISVNRWCVIDFAGGRVTGATALSHAP